MTTTARGALVLLLIAVAWAVSIAARDASTTRLLASRYPQEFVAARLQPLGAWQPFPPAADRAAWDRLLSLPLHQARRTWVVAAAERELEKPWPALPATLYMEFARNGNRSRYEQPYFERRKRLATLVIAECFEHRGRFLDEIANGLWAITEEATWCVPAHAARAEKDVLHRQDLQSVDLFAAETAMTLATARYLLSAELEHVSPALSDRVKREVLRRVVEPVESGAFGSDWWMDGRNNWSPWCASNVLGAAMFLVDDTARLARLTCLMMDVADRFIDGYGDDGGCDEGPGYWNEAGGALLVLLELLHSRTGGAVNIYAEPKIAAMGAFIANAHISGPWFVNFSDADARTTPHPGKVYRYGERTRQAALQDLALLAMRSWKADGPVTPPLQLSGVSRALLGPLMEIFWIPADAPGSSRPTLPASIWMPSIQTLVARESGDAPYSGLFVSARGGHNAESHNHNDVGNLVVYLDGQPGVIDVGRETYTAQTFGKNRYDLWFTRGSAHNAPVVNGVEQQDGREYQATEVAFRSAGATDHLSMNLEHAYPAEAGLRTLRREIEVARLPSASVRVRDSWALASGPGSLRYTFYAAAKAERSRPGTIRIECGARTLALEYEPVSALVAIEVVPMQDPIMRDNWGPELRRIVLDVKAPQSGAFTMTFRGLRDCGIGDWRLTIGD